MSTEELGVRILRAFQPGDVVFIECDVPLSMEVRENVLTHLRALTQDTGVKIVLLFEHMRIAAREEVPA